MKKIYGVSLVFLCISTLPVGSFSKIKDRYLFLKKRDKKNDSGFLEEFKANYTRTATGGFGALTISLLKASCRAQASFIFCLSAFAPPLASLLCVAYRFAQNDKVFMKNAFKNQKKNTLSFPFD